MKKIYLLAILVLVFSACPEYQSYPETELKVVDITFNDPAVYNPASNSITLTFSSSLNPTVSTPLPYNGIYRFYNKSENFDMAAYLKNAGSPGIKSTTVVASSSGSITGITIELLDGVTRPPELVFKTDEPMYLYNARGPFGNIQNIIEAKAYIKTPTITVP
jgi:hypothetical protein